MKLLIKKVLQQFILLYFLVYENAVRSLEYKVLKQRNNDKLVQFLVDLNKPKRKYRYLQIKEKYKPHMHLWTKSSKRVSNIKSNLT